MVCVFQLLVDFWVEIHTCPDASHWNFVLIHYGMLIVLEHLLDARELTISSQMRDHLKPHYPGHKRVEACLMVHFTVKCVVTEPLIDLHFLILIDFESVIHVIHDPKVSI